MNLSERSQRTIEQIINRANGEGRSPSLRLISEMLREVGINHTIDDTSRVNSIGSGGGRISFRQTRVEGIEFELHHRLRHISVDTSSYPFSRVSEDVCDDLVIVLMAENII